jgi:hypothetical protein
MEPQASAIPEREGFSTKAQLQALLWRMRAEQERFVAEAGPARLERPGASGDWTLKDVVAHLTFWRWWSVARLESAVRKAAPVPPWGSDQDEESDEGVDRINAAAHEAARGRSIAEVLRDSRETFERAEAAIAALADRDLFTVNRYPWLVDYAAADIVLSSAKHLFEHAIDINLFLARTAPE